MRNLIVILGAILIYSTSFSQEIKSIDTLHFTSEKSYSRALARYSKNELVFGTSKTGVILYNEKTKKTKTLIKPVNSGEFRDVIVDEKKIYTCVSGDSGIIYKVNGKKVSELYREACFIDDIVLKNRELILLSDPVDKELYIKTIHTQKGYFYQYGPFKTIQGEAYYAASGTTAQLIEHWYYHVSGGPNNATFYRRSTFEYRENITSQLPLPKAEGAGPFSIFMIDEQNGSIVGGNYTKPDTSDSTACYTSDGGKTWLLSEKQPNGYRSCVTGNTKILFACGTNGIDYSIDGGKNWKFLMKGNFCALLLEENTLYATTNKGYCLKIKMQMK
ncbi:WD40/YVTN/BNR-like repeat-containing protein [Fluviicola taffensis]|uniref:Uncharacterized protein n=1 Tax=Fluviicola taffensis (strain DSM 16823 / NCIMB 13979 / RW262) TaxID=755732 RepID=F2IBM7_FLUTR|nr:sialidase family protein [Fluviicola taffensis]AEA45353.1 hypothetical protein Fluta_3381 [Fluviicola taffensis DSM 16823]